MQKLRISSGGVVAGAGAFEVAGTDFLGGVDGTAVSAGSRGRGIAAGGALCGVNHPTLAQAAASATVPAATYPSTLTHSVPSASARRNAANHRSRRSAGTIPASGGICSLNCG
jgi:hypothetical protein